MYLGFSHYMPKQLDNRNAQKIVHFNWKIDAIVVNKTNNKKDKMIVLGEDKAEAEKLRSWPIG